jgi:archaemetzincin
MGLGFEPGNACVISTFRLSKTNFAAQFYKVALHELGHTQGLPHCPNKTCLMRDAEGSNHLDEETGFCPSCKAYLKSKGWLIN